MTSDEARELMDGAIALLDAGEDIDGGASASAFTLDMVYVQGSRYQYAAEWLRNVIPVYRAMKADGLDVSQVRAVMDFVQTDVLNVANGDEVADPVLRRLWNVGRPMDPIADLEMIYSRINVSAGKDAWSRLNLDGSFGMGKRAALLFWTDGLFITSVPGLGSFGIILRQHPNKDSYSTYKKGRAVVFDEDGTPVTIGYDPATGENIAGSEHSVFKLPEAGSDEQVFIQSPDGKNVMRIGEAQVHEDARTHGGVTTILLGKDGYTDDVEIDHFREGEKSSGVPKFLRDRFIGGEFPVKVEYLMDRGTSKESGSFTHKATGGKVYYDVRNIKPLSTWLDRATA